MLKVAIIGCGNIGSKRALAISKDPSSKIKFLVGPQKKSKPSKCKGRELAKKLKCKYLNNWRDILSSDINAVVISTPTQHFEKIGSAILNSKKHLLIEKPLGKNFRQSKRITNLAKKNKVILKTGFNLRFDEGIRKAKSIVDSGMLGKIYFIKSTYVNGSVLTNNNNVGSLLDIGTHSTNLVEFFTNKKKVKLVKSEYQLNEYKDKDDNGFIILRLGKVIALVHFSLVRWENEFTFEISGKKGSVRVNSLPKWGEQIVTHSKRVFPSGKPVNKVWKFKKENSWYNEWIYFTNCIRKKQNIDLEEGLRAMKLSSQVIKKIR